MVEHSYLVASDDAQLSRRGALARERADSHSDRLGDAVLGADPVPDLARNYLNKAHARIVNIALMNA